MSPLSEPRLDPFEDRLLAELRQAVTAAPARRRTRRPIAVAAAVAASALVGVVLVPGLGTTPAYSVQEGNAGEIVVEVNRPEDAAGLEQALGERGVAADITYLPDLQECASGRFTEVDREVGLSLSIGEDLVRVTLPPGAVRDGETFVMVLSVEAMTQDELAEVAERDDQRVVEGTSSSVSAEVASGPVRQCQPVPGAG
ncbi:hypothetical protein [Nocardioides lacusdianchii]|uniref:hypothetical protein n=1 Tax=Nocardioides lacusdianchii TaxID=2783664 RepID=UPI001CCB5943|nr:hypothetical protein [Nocardioides lacusdianchii]